jgi:excisionase family DNA binding protein
MSTAKYLTVTRAAEVLSCTPKAVRQRIARGELPYRRWGRRVLIPAEELEAFMEALPGKSARQAASTVEESGACR